MKIIQTRTCTCRLKAMYTETLPLNIVPTATNLPSSETAKADKLSLHGTIFFNEPSSGSHSWRNAFCLPCLPTGFTSINSRVLFTSPSTKPNLITTNVFVISESYHWHRTTCESGYPCLFAIWNNWPNFYVISNIILIYPRPIPFNLFTFLHKWKPAPPYCKYELHMRLGQRKQYILIFG